MRRNLSFNARVRFLASLEMTFVPTCKSHDDLMNVIFISPIGWDNSGGAHRPVQFARALARRGHAVTYVEIEKSRTPPASENPRVLNFEQLGWDELNLVRAWYGFDYTTPPGRDVQLNVPTENGGVVICSAPFRPALEYLPALAAAGYAIVYDVLDDISEMRPLGVYCYDDAAEQYLAAQSDLIVTLSPRLREKFRTHPNGTLIRDGIDRAPFQQTAPRAKQNGSTERADELARGEITVGFWGTMWEYNLDVPLLQNITRARPNWQWHFIGAYDLDPTRPSLAQTLVAPNVHFHSTVSRETLARYAESFDVCILPTPVTPFNLARDPLKVYEYLACYKPVVSTNLEQLANMPYVYLAHDADEFLNHIERAAREKIDHAALDAYLQEQTWDKRTDALLNAIEKLPHHARTLPPPPRGAMPGAAGELDRVTAFAKHLERLVADREQHIDDLEHALKHSSVSHKVKRALGIS